MSLVEPQVRSAESAGLQTLRIPKHVAIIMDGNGRWARTRGWHRSFGHIQGSARVKEIVREADRIGISVLTLYAFSTENWSRPAEEIEALMHLLEDYLKKERVSLQENNVRLQALGQIERLPARVRAILDETIEALKNNTGLTLNFCISYGSRSEIVRAVQSLAREVSEGQISLADISEETISQRLYTGGLPDPDLLIRTSGEFRISNFLLWQSAYTEFYITDIMWPDFEPQHLRAAVEAYSLRKRRFGSTTDEAETNT